MPNKQRIVKGFGIEDVYQKIYNDTKNNGEIIKDHKIIRKHTAKKEGIYVVFMGEGV